jgi:hypothetical protein
LKALKNAYIHKLAGTPVYPEWIAFHSNGLPKGPLGAIFKCKKPHKVLSALMVYTGFKAKTVTNEQFQKFDGSAFMAGYPQRWGYGVETHPSFTLEELQSLTGLPVCSELYQHTKTNRFAGIPTFLLKHIRVPSLSEDGSSIFSEELTIDSLVASMSHPAFEWWMMKRSDVPSEYKEAFWSSPLAGKPVTRFARFDAVGRVSFLQEPGYKLRAVFNPLPCFQLALSDMGTKLFRYLKTLPEDCTFNQDQGVSDVAEALEQGLKLATLDLSDATNSFPLEVTMHILRSMNPKLDIHEVDMMLFEYLSTAPWRYPKNPAGKETCFLNRGQPLGLYPSFAAFALSHHVIVRACQPKFYRVLGDDIVIDAETAKLLRVSYQRLGVKLSEQKCFESDQLAEFAGKVIIGRKTYVQPKHKQLSDWNFVDVVKAIPNFIRFALPRQRKVLSYLNQVHRQDSPYGLARRYIDIPERPLIASYQWSQILSELLEGEEALDSIFISPFAKQLKRLGLRMHLRHIRKNSSNAFSGIDPEHLGDEAIYEDRNSMESRILIDAGVNQVSTSKPIPGWSHENEIPTGRPQPLPKPWVLLQKRTLARLDEMSKQMDNDWYDNLHLTDDSVPMDREDVSDSCDSAVEPELPSNQTNTTNIRKMKR